MSHRRNKTSHAVMAAIEREHQRFASELHDGICQELAGIAFTIDALRPAVAADTAETLKCISDHVRRLASDTKRLALGLAPLALESTGLCGALMLLQHEIHRSGNCELLLSLDERALRSLSTDVALNLFRIGQEATMNAIRHGEASRISIHLTHTAAGIEFSVDDDGCGVGESLLRPRGLGIYSMMWRAEWLGSELKVLPRVPRGTSVILLVAHAACSRSEVET
jgi:signal transduction histidine kinase